MLPFSLPYLNGSHKQFPYIRLFMCCKFLLHFAKWQPLCVKDWHSLWRTHVVDRADDQRSLTVSYWLVVQLTQVLDTQCCLNRLKVTNLTTYNFMSQPLGTGIKCPVYSANKQELKWLPIPLHVLCDKFSERLVFSASHRMSTAVNF
jgi:hypothetical protein